MVGQHSFLDGEGDKPKTKRERRIAEARDTDMVCLALSSTARYGCYVFDRLIVDGAGMLDYLAIGPLGVLAIPVRFDEGHVSCGTDEDDLLLDGEPFEDDPFLQLEELGVGVSLRLFGNDSDVTGLVCFTRVTFELDARCKPPAGTTPTWELSRIFNPAEKENSSKDTITPADIEEIAEKVQNVYCRPPIVIPVSDEWERP